MTSPASTDLDDRPARPDWTGLAIVVGIALVASAAGLANGYAFDDVHVVQLNERLHGLARWREILTSPYWPPPWNQEHYRPVTSLLLAAQYGLGSGGPVVFRIVSYLLHAATAAGVLVFAGRFLPRAVALAAAALFAAHPVHVEPVAQAVGQGELLIGLLGLAMLIHYVDRRRGAGMRLRDWGAIGAAYVVASLAKEHGMVLPALLLAAEIFLLEGSARERARRLAPGYASLAVLALAIVALRVTVLGGEFSGNWIGEGLEHLSPLGRVLTALSVVPQWARLLVWPAHLQADYSPQEMVTSAGFGTAEAIGLGIVVAALAAGWLAGRDRRAPMVAFGLGWMAITLFPASNVVVLTSALLAERQLFLPSIGFVLALGGGVVAVGRRVGARPWHARTARVAVTAIVVAAVARSAERHRVWRNDAFFVVRSVQDAPRSYRMQRAYGDVLFELGERNLAGQAYRLAIELAPRDHRWRVRNDLARRLRARQETAAEVEQLVASLEEEPVQEDTRGYLTAAYLALGEYAAARREADAALRILPEPSEVFSRLQALADSAASVAAPPGSVLVRIGTGPAR